MAKPYRTAAECIDFSLPVPSIFLTPGEAKAWGRLQGVPAPRRPLATATLRRVARGVMRFVVESADPFIIPVRHHGDDRVHSVHEPLRTLAASDREFALVAPTLIQTSYGERRGQEPRTLDLFEPLGTVVAGGVKHSLVAAFLAKYHGAKPGLERIHELSNPIATLDTSNRFALVAAHLVKHNGGNEATGQRLVDPTDTITCLDSKALVTSHLLKLRGGLADHDVTSQDMRAPIPTLTAGGTHLAAVYGFLLKYYGSKVDGCSILAPLDTITTKDRFGLVMVTVAGEQYVLVDMGMRLLTPRELFNAQGFPASYRIDTGIDIHTGAPVRFSKRTQTRLVGNSVSPYHAAAVIGANLTVLERSCIVSSWLTTSQLPAS